VIEHLGYLKDVRPAYEKCSVYVLPSYREGTPRTVLESMAMGRPIITTDAPGCRETVRLEGGQTEDCRLQTLTMRLKTKDGRANTLLYTAIAPRDAREDATARSLCSVGLPGGLRPTLDPRPFPSV